MERPIIESMVASLPFSEMGQIPSDHEIWEDIDEETPFSVTHHLLTSGADGSVHEVIALSVFGEIANRQRLIDEFVEIFGEYADAIPGVEIDDPHTILWVVKD